MDSSDDQVQHRRAVFLKGLGRLIQPLAQFIEDRVDIPLPVLRTVLRPPGALPEREFLQTCYRCGNCMDVCPARCIRPMSGADLEQSGTPYIDPDLSACVICDELACMKACPSGALRLVSGITQIRMGRAAVDYAICVRSAGEACTLCVDKCPLGAAAIGLDEAGAVAVRDGCVGCGVCQFYCPTNPKAVRVEPA
jgi:MauM/NapG family ferredoxin protein